MGMTLEEIKELNAYHLAEMADCASPDNRESAGAAMLTRVRDGLVGAIESGSVTLDDLNDSGQLHEIADNAPSVYTHEKWGQFLDLCAYQEKPDDGEWPEDLDKAASCALYQIADRLAHSLAEEWRDGWECPMCGDSGQPITCTPDECYGTGYDDEDEGEDTPAEAILTGPVDVPAVLNAELDAVTARETSDPILDLIEDHERQVPKDDTAAFLAYMGKVNTDEFGDGRRYRLAAVVWAVGWLTLVVGVVGMIVWGLTR